MAGVNLLCVGPHRGAPGGSGGAANVGPSSDAFVRFRSPAGVNMRGPLTWTLYNYDLKAQPEVGARVWLEDFADRALRSGSFGR